MTSIVTVKPLVWEQIADTQDAKIWQSSHALSLRGWEIDLYEEDPSYQLRFNGSAAISSHPTLKAAKAAAQLEWETFIRAAIQ